MGLKKQNKPALPKFPSPPKEDGGKEKKEKTPNDNIVTKDQDQLNKILQEQKQALQDNGLYRLNLIDQKTTQNTLTSNQNQLIEEQKNISVELGKKVLERLDRIAVALENLSETKAEEEPEEPQE